MIVFWCVMKVALFFRVVLLNLTFFWSACLFLLTILVLLLKKIKTVEKKLFELDVCLLNKAWFQKLFHGLCQSIYTIFTVNPRHNKILREVFSLCRYCIIIILIGFFLVVQFADYSIFINDLFSMNLPIIYLTFLGFKILGWYVLTSIFIIYTYKLNELSGHLSKTGKLILTGEQVSLFLEQILRKTYPEIFKI
jgi:hypothetical protein